MITRNEIKTKTNELVALYKSYLLTGEVDITDIRYEGVKERKIEGTEFSSYSNDWRAKIDGYDVLFYTLSGLVKDGDEIKFDDHLYMHTYDRGLMSYLLDFMSDEEIATICKHIINKSNVQPQNMD